MVLQKAKWSSLSLWQKAVLFAVIYILCAEAGSYLSARSGAFVSFWLPAGLYLAVLLLNRTRDWPWFLLAALPANFFFDLLHDQHPNPVVIFSFYCANTVQTVAGAWLVRRFVAETPTLDTLKEFIGLVGFAAIFSATLGAVIGAATLVHFGFSQSFEQSWKVWWCSNAMTILLLTPFILTWFSKPKRTRNDFGSPKKIVEAVALLLALVVYIWLLFSKQGIMSMNRTWAIPLLLWSGLRFGTRGATAISLLFALFIAFLATQYAIALNGVQISTSQYIFLLHAILAMASLIALIPAIVIGERDRTFAKLQESEERFKNLSAAAFEGIAISQNGIILDVNNQYLAMFGLQNRDEAIGRQIVEFVAPESREVVTESFRTGRETVYCHQLLRKDGSVFFAEAQARMVHVGNRTLRMTALRDITERKEVEQALRESEEKFSKAFRASPDGICITEFESGRFMEVNDGYCKLFQFTREELIGRTPLELRIFEKPTMRQDFLDALTKQGSVQDMELVTRRNDGQTRLVRASAERIELGAKQCIVSVIHDITNSKLAEETLRKSEALFRSYFELAVVGCVISSLEKGIIAVNNEFCRIVGYSHEELQKMTWLQLTHPDDIDDDVNQFNSVLSGKIDSYVLDKRYLHKDGREVYVTLSVRCVRHPDGSPDYFIALAMDITSRHEAILREQQARAEYTFRLIAAQEAERTRIARELHDSLGQNLLLIKNRAQLEMIKTKMSGGLREQFQEISNLASRAISEARNISHDLHPHQLDHLGLTRSLKAMIESADESSAIEIYGKFDPSDDIFSSESAMNIYRIVQESLSNILKHSRAKKVRITLERDIHEVILKIEDDGCGFNADQNGKGLGLKNIAERARMLGGKLKMRSAPGKGTRIEIAVPISTQTG